MRNLSNFLIRKLTFAFLVLIGVYVLPQIPKSSFSISNGSTVSSLNFQNTSENSPTSYLWSFPGGVPSASSLENPIVTYSSDGIYTASLVVTNANGTSTSTITFEYSNGNIIDLSTGRNEDGTLMATTSVIDPDWTHILPDNTELPVFTRHTYTGWYNAQIPPDNSLRSVWVTSDTAPTEIFYKSKTFTIPENVSNAKMLLRSLSFTRNWTYLVKINPDNSTDETLITQTTWMSDGAKGWFNSRSPLVDNLPIAPGTYYLKIRVVSGGAVRNSMDVNGFVNYSLFVPPSTNFEASTTQANSGTPINFSNLTQGSPISFEWKFFDGTNVIPSNLENPVISFSEEGIYDVELKVTYANGLSSKLLIEDYIEITNPEIDYTLAPNSYIFDPYQDEYDGLFIPVKKAYDIWKDENGYFNQPITNGTLTASILWQDNPGLIKSNPATQNDEFDLELIGNLENSKIKVIVDKTKGEGNAVIAFKVNGIIKWSWHIWVTDSPDIGASNHVLENINMNLDNEYFAPTFMDRNLGATSNHFLGNEWNKSGGLMYQWGRKDPFPSLVYKDYTFYEVEGEIGLVKHKHSKSSNLNTIDDYVTIRPNSNINENLKFAIQNPFNYIYTTDNSNWFSATNNLGPIPGDSSFNQMFDLWGDNFGGKRGGYLPGNANYKPYPLKSSFDPCPRGWRVPSHNSQQATRNYFSPWGRFSSFNDDNFNSGTTTEIIDPNINGGKPASYILANVVNPRLEGIKIYPGLGVDFSGVSNRNIGVYPLTGGFEQYGSGIPYFQDPFSESSLWTATSYNNSARSMHIVADYARLDHTPYGLNTFHHVSSTATQMTKMAQAVRCIADPNDGHLPNFSTEYILSDTTKRNYTVGLENPNSYIVPDNLDILNIPISKAFSVYNQYLTDREWPSGEMNTKVVWTTNTSLIKKVSLTNANLDNPNNGLIKIEFGENNPKGNAVVALTINNNIIWSWHIWASNDDPTLNTITYTNEEDLNVLNFVNATKSGITPITTTFMDRNLGALEAFPTIEDQNTPSSNEIMKIEQSGGLHFQWGRKDPIPTFNNVGSGNYMIYLETEKDSNGNSIYGNSVNASDYLDNYTTEYSIYGAPSSSNRMKKVNQSLNYSVQNPLNFLYHQGIFEPSNYFQIKDWIADERNLGENRWGHANKKSPFDPCPDGWRVPDVSFTFLESNTIQFGSNIHSGAIGSSPWYNKKILSGSGAEQNRHLIQNAFYDIDPAYYEGKLINGYGWIFNDPSYHIGNYPATGIRGYVGNNHISNHNTSAGIWTSSLSDSQFGYAIGLHIGINPNNSKGNLKSGGGFYPQAGLNVRCSKDEPMFNYLNNDENNKNNEEQMLDLEKITVSNENDIFYPNPVFDYLYTHSKDQLEFKIYTLNGGLIKSGKFKNSKIDLINLEKGVYIITIYNLNNQTQFNSKLIKK